MSSYGARKRALADLVRFGSLIEYRQSYVASVTHWPDLSHDRKTIDAIVKDGDAVRHGDGSVCVTAAGKKAFAAYEAATQGAA